MTKEMTVAGTLSIEEAAQAIGMKDREVVQVRKADQGGHLVTTFDGNVVHLADDGTTTPAGRVSNEELAQAKRKAADDEGPADPAPSPKRR